MSKVEMGKGIKLSRQSMGCNLRLPYCSFWRSMLPHMDPENLVSRAFCMKGMAVDLPFVKFRYLKVQGEVSGQAAQRRKVDSVSAKQEERRSLSRVRMEFQPPSAIKSLGLDPMVSSASVIHELAYGRMEDTLLLPRLDAKYAAQDMYQSHQLDVFV